MLFTFGERMKPMMRIFGWSAAISIIFGIFFGLVVATNDRANNGFAAMFLIWSMMAATISFCAAFFILMDRLYDRG